jgi:soluble lytic murein transglycosylase
MREESAFEPHAASAAKAYGLMQLIVPTAERMARALNLPFDEDALKRPEVNIPLGCHTLADLRHKFPDNVLLAIPGYNAGDLRPKEWVAKQPTASFDLWVEDIPFEETRLYTKRVIGSIAAYEFLYAPDKPSEALRSPLAASPEAAHATASATP